jgi:biopolymer transport protein TolR
MAFGERNSNETLSQINVTPLVDVMLVLLVIFMVTAPILHQGVSVNLPRVRTGALAGDDLQLVVSLTADGTIYLNDTPMASAALAEKLNAILEERPDRQIFLRADSGVRYGAVMEVMSGLHQAGVQRLGMVTEPPEPQASR